MATDEQIRAAIAEADRVLAGAAAASPYPRELFPELARRDRQGGQPSALATGAEPEQPIARRAPVNAEHPRPGPAAQGPLTPEQVGAWSGELGFTRSAKQGRVTRADD